MAEQTNPQAGVAQAPPSLEDRMVSVLGGATTDEPDADEPEEQEVEARTDAAPEPEGASDEALTADDLPDETPAPEPSGDAFEIVHAGKQHKLNREETIRYAQQGFDYTQKTQALAEQAKVVNERLQRVTALEQVAPQLQQAQAQVSALEQQLRPYQSVDWVALATNDPLEYSKHRAQYDVLAQTYQRAAGQYQHMRSAMSEQAKVLQAQALEVENRKMLERIPEWSDPAKFKEGAQALRNYLVAEGADPAEVDGLTSSVAVNIAYKAMRYDQLVKSKAEKSKLLRPLPQVTRPGADQSRGAARADQQTELRSRLKKTGDIKDAAALLESRLR